ncbi:MAG TPA: hypothetical protein VG897_13970 [Terriglobales bacterium]|nr:hypothetical protein [Terriglobales bacterium]
MPRIGNIILLSIIVFSTTAFAQANLERIQSSCGPSAQQFDVHNSNQKTPLTADSSKAQVIVVEKFDRKAGEMARPTLRIGVDGSWVGATRDNSYLAFLVEPGEHHMCVQWQSSFSGVNQIAAFTQMTAEPGKTYYFMAQVKYPPKSGGSKMRLSFDAVDQSQGEYLVNTNPVSNPKPKH